jgi:flagellar protein FlgJ
MSIAYASSDRLSQRLAVDPQALANMSSKIARDPKGAVHEVAQQFEAMFLNNLLKSMRETHFSDDDQSNEMQTWHGMFDEQLVQSLASSQSGVGIGKVLEQQFLRLAKLSDNNKAPPSPILPPVSGPGWVPGPTRALQAYRMAEGLSLPAFSGTVSTGPHGADTKQFVAGLLPAAQSAATQLGVSPAILVAHAALESGWGQRPLLNADGSNSHNLFDVSVTSSEIVNCVFVDLV